MSERAAEVVRRTAYFAFWTELLGQGTADDSVLTGTAFLARRTALLKRSVHQLSLLERSFKGVRGRPKVVAWTALSRTR